MPDLNPISSNLPDAWGGPFIWHRNERGNLTLIRVSDLTGTARFVVDMMQAEAAR